MASHCYIIYVIYIYVIYTYKYIKCYKKYKEVIPTQITQDMNIEISIPYINQKSLFFLYHYKVNLPQNSVR